MERAEKAPETLSADKGYHGGHVVGFCRKNGIKPHVAAVKGRHVHGLDVRTTRNLGHRTGQKVRQRTNEVLGWCKELGGLCRTREHGTDSFGLSTLLVLSFQNLVRMGKLRGSRSGSGPATAWAGPAGPTAPPGKSPPTRLPHCRDHRTKRGTHEKQSF